MKNKLIYILFVALFFASSCNDWLNVAPKTELPEKEMFKEEDGFKDALTACYVKMGAKELYGEILTMTGIDYMAQYWDLPVSTNKDDVTRLVFANFDYKASEVEKIFREVYLRLYNVATQANLVYRNIKSTDLIFKDEKMKDIIKGEALAIRAFCHFDLLRLYGQMPTNSSKKVSLPYAEEVSIDNIPLYDYTSYIAKIEADLIAAEKLLENDPLKTFNFSELTILKDADKNDIEINSYYKYRRFRFNFYALKALQARFYLYIGKKSEAYTAANIIINGVDRNNSNVIDLAGDGDLNSSNYILPSEAIFTLSHNEFTLEGDIITDKLTMSVAKLEKELFKGRSLVANNRYTQGWGKRNTDNQKQVPRLMKYIQQKDANVSITPEDLMRYRQQIPIFRLSEIYLIAMESAPTLSETNRLYHKYMLARNEQATDFTDAIEAQSEIVNEYRREFIAEGQMFFTYKRLWTKEMLWKIDREVNEDDYVIPMPTTELKK